VLQAIAYVGYQDPSPIQRAALPLGLKQLDVIGIAETGSGKTAAFVLPMLAYIMKQVGGGGVGREGRVMGPLRGDRGSVSYINLRGAAL
jgi:superfamily II DNA/RNA helicase